MRRLVPCCFLFALGCGGATPGGPAAPVAGAEPAAEAKPTATSGPDAALPPDLGTRKAGVDWPRFLGPGGDGTSPEKGIVTDWSGGGPRLVWEQRLGASYAMPVVSRGRLFHFDRAGDRARVHCSGSETGEPLWTFEYPTDYEDAYGYGNGPRCCPVVDRDRVYTFGAEGLLHCLTAADGELVWKVDTRADFGVVQNFFGVGSTPVVEGDLLLVQVGGSPKGDDVPFGELKGNGSGLVAFDKYTGKVHYRVTDELASYAGPVAATVGGRRWCFLFARGGLVGLEPESGKVDFRFPWRARILESVNASNPVVVGDTVFISETYGPGSALLKVKPGACEPVWTDADKGRNKSMQCHWMTPIHVGGYLYGCSGRHTNNAELRCIELATGKVKWSEPGLTRTSLLLADGHFICLGEDGVLRLLKVNPEKYDEVARLVLRPRGADGKPDGQAAPLLQYPCWAAPALSHGLLYVRGRDRLVCLDLIPATGRR
jgi:outer membrane protein assembly factor BamB